MEDKSKNPIQVADRLFLTLETLAKTGPITLAELQHLLQLNKSTVHRLLTSLVHMGYVRQNEESGRYSLTLKIISLSNQLLENLDIVDEIRPYLKKFANDLGETVHFVQIEGTDAVYIAKEESYQNSVRMVSRIGNRIPLYCSGVGKAILADMSLEKVKKIWDESSIRPLTPYTITEYPKLLERLEQVRAKGYALDDEENELGVRCIAVSIPRYDGTPKYALSISAPVTRMSDERIAELSHVILEMKRNLLNVLR